MIILQTLLIPFVVLFTLGVVVVIGTMGTALNTSTTWRDQSMTSVDESVLIQTSNPTKQVYLLPAGEFAYPPVSTTALTMTAEDDQLVSLLSSREIETPSNVLYSE